MAPQDSGANYAASAASAPETKERKISLEIDISERAPSARNPFETPYGSMPASAMASSVAFPSPSVKPYFRSRRIKKDDMEKPWLTKKDPREKWVWIIPLMGIAWGAIISGYLIYQGTTTVSNYRYCQVLDEDFSRGFNADVWTKEVESGGFG